MKKIKTPALWPFAILDTVVIGYGVFTQATIVGISMFSVLMPTIEQAERSLATFFGIGVMIACIDIATIGCVIWCLKKRKILLSIGCSMIPGICSPVTFVGLLNLMSRMGW